MIQIQNLNSLIGKYVHIVSSGDYPVFLFNIQEIHQGSRKGFKEFISEQVLDSPNSDDLEVYCGSEWEIDMNNDDLIGIYDTPEELFSEVVQFLKDQIKRCSGIIIK